MNHNDATWAIVLAAGDGKRLSSLTTDPAGVAVPKQFCSLRGGDCLLQETLYRAHKITPPDRVVAIVAGAHRDWWQPVTTGLRPENIVVQPRNRATGNGILLPLLHILNRDPLARVAILPSDHYIHNEPVLLSSLRQAALASENYSREIVLLGIAPEEPDPELGYIQPGAEDFAGLRHVRRFVEKPEPHVARALLAEGGVWNSFIMAARGQALLDLYAVRFPDVVTAMIDAMRAGPGALSTLYDGLPDVDFSRHVITGHEDRLRLLSVPSCGWSDLGTPERVARCLANLPCRTRQQQQRPSTISAVLDLASAHLRVQTQYIHQ